MQTLANYSCRYSNLLLALSIISRKYITICKNYTNHLRMSIVAKGTVNFTVKALKMARLLFWSPFLIRNKKLWTNKNSKVLQLMKYFTAFCDCSFIMGMSLAWYVAQPLISTGKFPVHFNLLFPIALLLIVQMTCFDFILWKNAKEFCYLVNQYIKILKRIEGIKTIVIRFEFIRNLILKQTPLSILQNSKVPALIWSWKLMQVVPIKLIECYRLRL